MASDALTGDDADSFSALSLPCCIMHTAGQLSFLTRPPHQPRSQELEILHMVNSDRARGGAIAQLLRRGRSFLAFLCRILASSAVLPQPKVLVVVEGRNDVEFLRRISAILHREDTSPNNS